MTTDRPQPPPWEPQRPDFTPPGTARTGPQGTPPPAPQGTVHVASGARQVAVKFSDGRTAAGDGSIGVGFAIPIDSAKKSADGIIGGASV